MLGNIGAGLEFMNQDFGVAFGGKPKHKKSIKHEGKTGKGVTIHVDGTTIHVGHKGKKAIPKKKKTSMFDIGF
jgi:hypothetical protein